MTIKYDQKTVNILKWVSVICIILFLSGLALLYFDENGRELMIFKGFFLMISLYGGGAVGIVASANFVFGNIYLSRLKKYGYEVPYKKREYKNRLENLPGSRNNPYETKTSLCSRDSQWLFYIALVCWCLFIALDVIYYSEWEFMKSDSVSTFIFQGLFYSAVWLVLAFTALRQRNPEKYRDDVAPDTTKKVRMSLERGLLACMILCCVCLVINVLANTMTNYVFGAHLSNDSEISYAVRNTTKSILDKYMTDGVFTDEECMDTYESLCEGVEVTTWTEPSDPLQQEISDYVFSVADDYKTTQGPARIFMMYSDERVFVKVLNLIPEALRP